MTRQQRNMVLGLALAATLGLVAWVESREEAADEDMTLTRPEVSSRPVRAAKVGEDVRAEATINWPLLEGREPLPDARKQSGGLFKPHSWYVPPTPPPPPPPAPPPKPVAPPVPFVYMGKLEDAPQGTLFLLSANNKVYTAAVGDTLEKAWRLEGEDANTLKFTHLPLGLPQIMSKSANTATAAPAAKSIKKQGNPE